MKTTSAGWAASPGDGLMEVTGVWAEEMDALFPTDRNAVAFEDNAEGFAGRFAVREMAEIIHPREGCEVLAVYAEDFYKGTPAVTRNRYGKGGLLPFAARTDNALMDLLYDRIMIQNDIEMALGGEFPLGVTVQQRYGDGENLLLLL